MKKTSYACIACATLGLGLASCTNQSTEKPDPTRQAWRDSCLSLPAAKAGSPTALHLSFQAARDQVMMPFVNGGEDAEAIAENLEGILDAVGDDVFSKALLKEEPETRSAVRDCMFESSVKKRFPITHKILREAPRIKWPSQLAYERSYKSMGQIPPESDNWKP